MLINHHIFDIFELVRGNFGQMQKVLSSIFFKADFVYNADEIKYRQQCRRN